MIYTNNNNNNNDNDKNHNNNNNENIKTTTITLTAALSLLLLSFIFSTIIKNNAIIVTAATTKLRMIPTYRWATTNGNSNNQCFADSCLTCGLPH